MTHQHTTDKQAWLTRLYLDVFPSVSRMVKKSGGTLGDAKDVFHDAIVILFERPEPASDLTNPAGFLMGIAKHLWLKRFRDMVKERPLDEEIERSDPYEEKTDPEFLLRLIESSGRKCLELLTAFYYDKLTMEKIASRFGFSGERSATSQKFKCLEKVRHRVKSLSLTKASFYE